MKNRLNEIKSMQKKICVYTDHESTTSFIFGELCGIDDDFFAINSITPTGKDDGIVIKLIEDIIKIEFDGQYCDKMAKITEPQKQYSFESNGILNCALDVAIKNHDIVSIELLKSGLNDVVGFPIKVIDNICEVSLVDEYGYSDGFAVFKIEDVTQMSLISESEMSLTKLFERNNQTNY